MGRATSPGRLAGATLTPAALEAEYRGRFLREDAWYSAALAAAITLGTALFSVNDVTFVADPATRTRLAFVRVAFVVVTAIAISVIVRTRRPAVADGTYLAWVAAGTATAVAIQSTRPGGYYLPLTDTVFFAFVLWTSGMGGFAVQGLGAMLYTLGGATWLLAFRDPPPLPVARYAFTALFMVNLVGALFSWRLHRARRLLFLTVKDEVASSAEVRRGEEHFRRLVQSLPVPVLLGNERREIVLLNGQFQSVLGYGPEDLPDAAAWESRAYPDPAYRREVQAAFEGNIARARDGDGAVDPLEVRITCKDGSVRTMEVRGVVLGDGLLFAFHDLTGQKRAQEALLRSERLHRLLARHYPHGVVGLFDTSLRLLLHDGRLSAISPAPASLVGKTPAEFAPPGLAERIEGIFREALAGREGQVELTIGERIVAARTYPVRDEAGVVVMGMVMTEDVTEGRAMQAQLAVSARLAALGTLVAGVAHEINNPLTGELAGQGVAIEELEALLGQLRTGTSLEPAALTRSLEEALEALRDAQVGGLRIAAVVKDLAVFGRPDPRRARIRLVDVVDDAMRWLPASISQSATVHVENLGPPDVLASQGQIGQVIVNLVTNAAKAAPAGRMGEIRLRIGPGTEGMARIEVADDGVGIEPEVLKRIFDPFFTTRSVGQGMGLGLPICHAIVASHGGHIAVTSAPGQGSTFRVELPAADPGGAPCGPTPGV